jgi:L-seryl-tRNA(Ser) seleniumtransferase
VACHVHDDESFIGGGSLPEQALPTAVVAVQMDGVGESELARRLRIGTIAVVARVQAGELRLDLRTVFPVQDEMLVEALLAVANATRESP